ncbi:multidrug effflux MFS transporter [Psychromarinibacter sp. C21-152]|uniref:Bcr/CflA family efflux transporter n=1 Tax=Psychromarinibacter sediminicola TaxID=3033385 RepID=A0AAE3T9J2_9RHOB|nr:multidrug effflux MFS transporter [Psychromarinibacter sediminicola]MDF0600580.1 multidrug effflux MFS transporter [Psychromarinibacter sediminicola]
MTRNSGVRFLDRSTPPHIFTLIVMASTSALAMNMYVPSLPSMAEHFDADYGVIARSVTLFLLGNAILQLFIGPVADRFGRRPVMLGGLAIFVVATIGCLLAPNVTVFLTFRMLQAFIVVGMVLSRAVVRDTHDQANAASMIGYVTMGMAVVPMLSPALGGLLDEWLGWRANFWAFLLFGLATLWLIWADQGETNRNQSASFRQQFRDYPELLTSPRFWGYALAAALSSGAFFSYVGSAPLIGSDIFGLSPSMLGVMFGAPALGYILGNYLTGRYSAQVGINRMIIVGALICAGGVAASLVLFLAGFGTPLTFFGFMCFVGLGNGMVLPNAIAGTLSVRPHLAGTASGLGGALMIGGGAALAQLAGEILSVETGPYPLLYIQIVVSILGVLAIAMVIRREQRLGLADSA